MNEWNLKNVFLVIAVAETLHLVILCASGTINAVVSAIGTAASWVNVWFAMKYYGDK